MLKNIVLFSSIAVVSPISFANSIINHSCDDYFNHKDIYNKVADEDRDIYMQLHYLIDFNPIESNYWTSKIDKYANEIGKYGDFVTPKQLGINLNYDPESFSTKSIEERIGHKITVDLSLIKITYRIYEINQEKGTISAAKKISYKDFCFYHIYTFEVHGFKK